MQAVSSLAFCRINLLGNILAGHVSKLRQLIARQQLRFLPHLASSIRRDHNCRRLTVG